MPDSDELEEVDPELFEKGIRALSAVVANLHDLKGELESLEETGLTHGDTVALLYGRRNSLNKTQVKAGLDALDGIGSANEQELIRRLLADFTSELNKGEAEQFVDELYDLRRRYGPDSEDDDE